MLLTILWFLVAIGILVTFHEFGHFYVARKCGVKVLRFSVGFGNALYTWKDRHGTEFVIASIPLGGYVKMLDEREGPVSLEDMPMAFTQKTVWQRIAILAAGPIANFILAILFYFVLASIGIKGVAPVIGEVKPNSLAAEAGLQASDEIVRIDGKNTPTWSAVNEQLIARIGDTGSLLVEVGAFSGVEGEGTIDQKMVSLDRWLHDAEQPQFLVELGIRPTYPNTDWVVTEVVAGGASEQAGIKVGDRLLSADGQALDSWRVWVEYVRAHPGQPIEMGIERAGNTLSLVVTPKAVDVAGEKVGKVGIATKTAWPDGMHRKIDHSWIESIQYGFVKTWDQSLLILSFLKKLLFLEVSAKNMGGMFTIAEAAGATAEAGFTYYLGFLAFFSVSLAVFNLLPIPVLDGGHLLFYFIEAFKGKPLPEKVQIVGYQIGLFIVVSVMILAHYNDITRIFLKQ